MSWGTDCKVDIFLEHIIIQNGYQLDERIQDVTDTLATVKEQLFMYASANPKDVTPDDWKEDGLSFIHSRFDELLIQYEQALKLLTDLNYYKETEPFKVKD